MTTTTVQTQLDILKEYEEKKYSGENLVDYVEVVLPIDNSTRLDFTNADNTGLMFAIGF